MPATRKSSKRSVSSKKLKRMYTKNVAMKLTVPRLSFNNSGKTVSPFVIKQFRYGETVNQQTGVGGAFGGEQVFNLSSIFKPNWLFAGHQPYGRDEVGAQYGAYLIEEVAWKLQWGTPTATAVYAGAMLQTGSQSFTVAGQFLETVIEKPGFIMRRLPSDGTDTIISGKMTMWGLYGITKEQYLNQTASFGALWGASPSVATYLRWAIIHNGGGNGVFANCTVVVDYKVRCFNTNIMAIS